MQQSHLLLLLGSVSMDSTSVGFSSFFFRGKLLAVSPTNYQQQQWNHNQRPRTVVVASAAVINSKQNHYDVLGISDLASAADIKKAYRFLARKYHPDVSKNSQAGETFKTIRLAYDVLSNIETRAQYDQALKFCDDSGSPVGQNWTYDPEFEEGVRIYRWTELRRQMRREKYWKQYESTEDESSSSSETEEEYGEFSENRGPLSEVIRFTFFTLFFMQTIGSQFTLMLCSLTALFDKKLDGGYKMGYLVAWMMGGRGGILLTLCLSFASWACGKTSSSLVALAVVAMWVGTNLARYAPLPQGAVIALLYMSVKLQLDLS